MGLADPLPIADDLLGVDVDALHQWFTAAARTSVRLWQGAGRLADALPLLAAGWSSPAPALAIGGQQQAGLASRDVIGTQVDAADAAGATLRQSRVLADDALADAEGAIYGTGWPPGDDLLRWAAEQQKLLEVSGTIAGLCHRLEDLRSRNENALHTLAAALRADPRDPVEQVAAAQDCHGRHRRPAPPAFARRPAPASPDIGQAGPGRRNRQRPISTSWRQDLQSTDVATLAMALGVSGGAAEGPHRRAASPSCWSTSRRTPAVRAGRPSASATSPRPTMSPSSRPASPTPRSSMADGISDAVALRDAAQQQAPGDSTAVVAWYGYDIPLSWMNGVPVNAVSTAGERRRGTRRRQCARRWDLAGRRYRAVPRAGAGRSPVRHGRVLDGRHHRLRGVGPRRQGGRHGAAGFAGRQPGRRDRGRLPRPGGRARLRGGLRAGRGDTEARRTCWPGLVGGMGWPPSRRRSVPTRRMPTSAPR